MSRQKIVLLLTVFIDMICFSMIFPVLPYFVKELNLSDIMVGIAAASFALMNFLFSPFWGSMSDRKGRRPVMLLSIAITFVANIILSFTNSLFLLLAARIMAGIGSANISVAQAYMADISKPEERTKNLGMVGAVFGLGFIIGPVVGGYLKSFSGEGSVLWVGLGAAIFNVINLASAWYSLVESNQNIDRNSKRSINPLEQIIRWLQAPVINQLMWIFFLYVTAFSMMQITSGLLWKEKYGLNEKQSSYVFALIGIVSALSQGLFIRWFTKRYTEKQLIISGALLMGISLALIPVPGKELFVPLELILVAMLAFGNALITPPLTSWLSKIAPVQSVGQVMGANQSFASLSRVIGPAVGGLLYPIWHSVPFFVSGGIMIIPLFLILKLKPADS
ncbi:MAG: MFS transporter [Lacibacter sp.]|jgi:MFS transporter, DHA1 family, tetracycline resistance protein